MQCMECRTFLSAYLDGALEAATTEAVRQHLASCEGCAAEYAAMTALSRKLKDTLPRRSAPDMLRARIQADIAATSSVTQATPVPTSAATTSLRAPRAPWAGLVAAAVLIAASSAVVSSVVTRRAVLSNAVAEQVLSSHVRSLIPGHLTDVASNNSHNVKPWFNGRVDLSPAVPRFDSVGFPLVGGRLDYIGGRPVAVVVYQRGQHVINVFSWPADGPATPPTVERAEHGYHLIRWHDADEEYWVVSDLNLAELRQFVTLFTQAAPAGEPR